MKTETKLTQPAAVLADTTIEIMLALIQDLNDRDRTRRLGGRHLPGSPKWMAERAIEDGGA